MEGHLGWLCVLAIVSGAVETGMEGWRAVTSSVGVGFTPGSLRGGHTQITIVLCTCGISVALLIPMTTALVRTV